MWTGKEYVTRSGAVLDVLKSWLEGMPTTPLDGELYAGPCPHEGRVKSAVSNGRWNELSFHPFDIPIEGTSVEQAATKLSWLGLFDYLPHVVYVPIVQIASTKAAMDLRDSIVKDGGEGIMLRKPGTVYQPWRTDDLLKMKP